MSRDRTVVNSRRDSLSGRESCPSPDTPAPERSCLWRTADYFLLQYLEPGEPFTMTVRKFCMLSLALIGGLSIFFTGYYISAHFRRIQRDPSLTYTGELHTGVLYLVYCFAVSLPVYFVLRSTRTATDGTVTYLFLGTIVLIFSACCATWVFPAEISACSCMIFGCNAGLPRAGKILLITGAHLTCLYSALRFAWPDVFMIPNRHIYSPLEAFLFLSFSHVMILSQWFLAHGSTEMFNRKVEEIEQMSSQAKASAHLAARVSRKLAKYDTDSVARELERYRADPGHDKAIARQFEALLRNLEKYRPHLPTWVLHTDEEGRHDSDTDGDEPEPCAGKASLDTEAEMALEDARSEARSVSVHNCDTQSVGSTHSYDAGTTEDAGASGRLTASSLDSHAVAKSMAPIGGWGQKAAVSVAYVSFKMLDTSDAALRTVVERMQRHATDTRGVVHSCINSTVVVSWGAATSSGRPELAAARFLARLKGMVDESLVEASGAAFTGPATVRLSGDARHQQLAVETPQWAGRLERLHRFARRHGVFVMDGALCKTIPEVATQLVATFDVGSQQVMGVCEVLYEHKVAEDEWMYQLQQLEARSACDDPVTAAARRCDAADFAVAMQLLAGGSDSERTPDSDTTTPAARHLAAIAATCLKRGATAEVYRELVEG